MKSGQDLAKFFLACAKGLLKGGTKTKMQAGAVAMFLECAQKSLGK